jgi:hypothetical protein
MRSSQPLPLTVRPHSHAAYLRDHRPLAALGRPSGGAVAALFGPVRFADDLSRGATDGGGRGGGVGVFGSDFHPIDHPSARSAG